MKKVTKQDKIIALLRSKEWVTNIELSSPFVWGWRFLSSIYELRKKGYVFEKKRSQKGSYIESFKLVSSPLIVTTVKWKKVKESILKRVINNFKSIFKD